MISCKMKWEYESFALVPTVFCFPCQAPCVAALLIYILSISSAKIGLELHNSGLRLL